MRQSVASADWLAALRRYFFASAVGNLTWEFAQLPLYTIWQQGSARQIVFAAVHCTGGDILIAGACLVAALMIIGNRQWPYARFRAVAAAAIVAGLVYTRSSANGSTPRSGEAGPTVNGCRHCH